MILSAVVAEEMAAGCQRLRGQTAPELTDLNPGQWAV